MSRVYFHSPSGEAKLLGSERAWLGSLCNDVTMGILNIRAHAGVREALRELLDPSAMPPWPDYHGQPDYFETFTRWCNSAELWMRHAEGHTMSYAGKPIDAFSLALNTASRVGGNALKLAARIHGQCEIHCYCEGVDRWWLADIIDDGLAMSVFRSALAPETSPGVRGEPSTLGWEKVARFLRDRDDEPVVLSYSVCDTFPNEYVANWTGAEDSWYDLPHGERWDLAMDGLRSSGGGLRIDPAEWGSFSFGHGLSAFDLRAQDWRERFHRALSPEPELAAAG